MLTMLLSSVTVSFRTALSETGLARPRADDEWLPPACLTVLIADDPRGQWRC